MSFSQFAKKHKNLSLDELVSFYSVFDGLDLSFEKDLMSSIKELLLLNYDELESAFKFDEKTSYALFLLAKNNRKRYSINRKISHFKASSIIKNLLEAGVLELEKSKEQKPVLLKNQKLKKNLRNYTIQDKVLFKNEFARFFFRFLKPNERLIRAGTFDEVLRFIELELEHYQSFCFEKLCREFLEKKFQITQVSSFWDKNLELDLYFKDENLCFVGEVKFKKRKICKNIYTLLQNKAKSLCIKPDFYVIFSKNGFSKEFQKSKEKDLLLFDLNDFMQICD